MEELLPHLADYGALGAIVAFLMWQNNKVTSRLMKIVEDNTSALVELKGIIQTSVERRKDA